VVTEPAVWVITHLPLQAVLPPLCMAALPSPIWKRTLVWLNYHTYLKNKGETCMVQEPSHVKQPSLIHMCKIGLKLLFELFLLILTNQQEKIFILTFSVPYFRSLYSSVFFLKLIDNRNRKKPIYGRGGGGGGND
jgi:hypothetical protein